MDENVGFAVVGHDEAVTLGGVEPFDAARDLDEPRGASSVSSALRGVAGGFVSSSLKFGPHSTRRRRDLAAFEPHAPRDWDHPLSADDPQHK